MTENHIKIPEAEPIARYLSDGSQTAFPFSFPIFASEDLKVTVDGVIQISGLSISGAGQTEGGQVVFDTAPSNGAVVVLERRLPLERLTDFLEGGDFSAQAINTELDFLIAAIQQVESDQSSMIRYDRAENPDNVVIPSKAERSGKVLGFDSSGNPATYNPDGVTPDSDFTASGFGAITRTSSDKLSDMISIKDFGAVGDGLTDDTNAIQQALTAHDNIYIPSGEYLITGSLILKQNQTLFGLGNTSIIKAQSDTFNVIEIRDGFCTVSGLKILGGQTGIKLYGVDGPCVQNSITDVNIIGAQTGLVLDGYNDTEKPCYWNNFDRILIEQMSLHGIHLMQSGAGDTPNANRFHKIRVFSKSEGATGSGLYVEAGKLNNSFMDCEFNMDAAAESCVRIGAQSDKTLLINILTEAPAGGLVPNIKLDDGSVETIIINLTSQSDGAAILDGSGGEYNAFNAGFPDKNTLRKTTVTDLKATLMRYDTEYISASGTITLDLSHSVHVIDAVSGALTVELPLASTCPGVVMSIKKKDSTSNIITIDEAGGGPGPDGSPLQLGGENDYATMISNGAEWFILSSNRMAGNTRFIDTSGTVSIDMAVDTYLISSFGGTVTAQLPPADAAEAIGRTVTIKKTDPSSNAVTITEQGGAGPDQSSQTLNDRYDAMTVLSDGGQWFVISRYG